MLLAADNGYQSCLMAPTEILASQHFRGLSELLKDLPVNIRLLTGSTKTAERREILQQLADGSLNMITGTHALIEDPVLLKTLVCLLLMNNIVLVSLKGLSCGQKQKFILTSW
jgi:ATP-dependent DNA helicase RecG